MHSVYTHRDAEKAVDNHFRSAARRFVLFDSIFVITLAAMTLLSVFFLLASVPILLLYITRSGILVSFLFSTRRRPLHVLRMYTTVPSSETHLRRGANLSQHPPLQVWYFSTLVAATAVHVWAFVALFVLVALGAFGFVVYAGLVGLVFLSYLYGARSHTRFYQQAVVDAVETELRTGQCEQRYAKSRSTELCERMLHDIDLYFHSKQAVSSIPSVSHSSQPSRRRSASLDRRAGRSTARRKNDRHSSKNRKQRHD